MDLQHDHLKLLRILWREGRLGRWELHRRTGIHPNTVGALTSDLIRWGILREGQAEPTGQGRPRVPVEIDPVSHFVLGVAIEPGRVQVGRMNLRGQLLGRIVGRSVAKPSQIVPTARKLLAEALDERVMAVGMSATGFLDPTRQTILFSSSLHAAETARGGARPHCVGEALSLEGLYDAIGRRPIVFENDMHALGARWVLLHQAEAGEDVLVVYMGDGRMGAAMLIRGSPNSGCMIAANELGHTRLPVATETCFCGRQGCLERICSSAFLERHGKSGGSLMERAAAFDGSDRAMTTMLEHLATGLGNAVNFVRPNRLVLVSEMTRYPRFCDALVSAVRANVLFELVQRVRIDVWDQPGAVSAETAGWLALAGMYLEGWQPLRERTPSGT